MTETASPPALRIGFIPGVTLRKWTRAWAEQYPREVLEIVAMSQVDVLAALLEHSIDAAFVRLPIAEPVDVLSRIRLYGEVATLVVARDSELADRESLPADEVDALDSVATFPPKGEVKDAVALVAAGVGSLRLPHSLARLHARKDVVAVPIDNAPETDIALVWPAELTTPAIEDFIGVVRGRSASSSRGRRAENAEPETSKTQPKKAAQGKTSQNRAPQNRGPARAQRRRRQGR